jgi:hypothetical protein
MRDDDYVAKLQERLAAYRADLGVPAGEWGNPPRTYGHILPREQWQLNLVEPLRDQFIREFGVRSWTLHNYFHHLSSSQALAFNLFLPLYPQVAPSLVATRAVLDIRDDNSATLDFEVVLPGIDGTNIDVLITEASGRRSVVEIKLTEGAFGRARNDLRHRKKLKSVYVPILRGRVADSVLRRDAFFRDYQLLRNLAQLRPGSDDQVILLLPRGRSKLWKTASKWCARTELGEFSGRIRTVALEDVVTALQLDSRTGAVAAAAIAATANKYLGTAG